MMRHARTRLVLAALAALAALLASSPTAARAGDLEDLEGIWFSKQTGLVIHANGESNFIGYPTDLDGNAGVTWRFHARGDGRYRFWVIVRGSGAEMKSEEVDVEVKDEVLSLPIDDATGSAGGPIELRRRFRPLAKEIAGVRVRFIPMKDGDPTARQYVRCSLADAFEGAVAAAKKVAPELRRINVAATVGQRVPRGRAYARHDRRGLAIDTINGVPLPDCGESLREAADRIEDGEGLPSPERHYAVYATALALCLIAREEVEACHAPDLFGQRSGLPYLEWFLRERGARLPTPKKGPGWKERIENLRKTNASTKFRRFLHVEAKPPERRVVPRRTEAFDEEYDVEGR